MIEIYLIHITITIPISAIIRMINIVLFYTIILFFFAFISAATCAPGRI